jgi:alpha-N-acetylglucosaminidase
MKCVPIILSFCFLLLAAVCSPPVQAGSSSPSLNTNAVFALIDRVTPGLRSFVRLEKLPGQFTRDTFEIEAAKGIVILRGSSTISLCAAFNYYLEQYCDCQVSQCGTQLNLPKKLPAVKPKIRKSTPYQYRFFYNHCTFSYTMPWWTWPQWEKEIDWLALQGVNAPYAFLGQEAIWQRLYERVGISRDYLRSNFFAGPAHLAWHWMGNLDGFGGPLPQKVIDGHLKLQKKIVTRMRSLGMSPVLPAFAGHVPPIITNRFPRARVKTMGPWSASTHPTCLLDPGDPLFKEIGYAFIKEQTTLFGTDHLYSADPFTENVPPSHDPAFLRKMGKTIYESMANVDRKAVWFLNGWMFSFDRNFWQPEQVKAFFSSVPDDKLVLIDLHCDTNPMWPHHSGFYGKPWIWTVLYNFGGNNTMHGRMPLMATEPARILNTPDAGHLAGLGFAMEGSIQNPVLYALWNDLFWTTNAIELNPWIKQFARQRYGRKLPAAEQAWTILKDTVYSWDKSRAVGSIIEGMPTFDQHSRWVYTEVWYDPLKLVKAWELLDSCQRKLHAVDTYQYDVVDVARQVLANLATPLQNNVFAAYVDNDRAALQKACREFLGLMRDMDSLLATRPEFLLGSWLEDARRWGATPEEKDLMEWNARNIITHWERGQASLNDYAHRQWSGLIKDYYLPRWQLFFNYLDQCIASNMPVNFGEIPSRIIRQEEIWIASHQRYPSRPYGNPAESAHHLLKKYLPILEKTYGIQKNLTTSKPVAASSGTQAEAAVDGLVSLNRYWDAHPWPQWWQVDLEKPELIGKIDIIPYWDGHRYYQYAITVSRDGTNWTQVVDGTGNSKPASPNGYRHSITPTTTRFIRITLHKNSANPGVHLVEVRAYPPGKDKR